MTKLEYRKLSRKQQSTLESELQKAFLKIPRKKDMVALLLDLLTPSERIMLARRIRVARRLHAGESYLKIKRDLKVGIDMISFVDKWLIEKYRRVRGAQF